MKKVICSAAAMLVLAVMLVSCKSGGPKANAEKFLNGLYHRDFAAAKEVSTEETKKQLETWESVMEDKEMKSAKEAVRKLKVEVKEPKINGDNATVEYTVSDDPSPKTLKMVKQNDKWLAQWSKMDMGGGMGGNGMGDTNSGMAAPPDTVMAPPADGMNTTPNK